MVPHTIILRILYVCNMYVCIYIYLSGFGFLLSAIQLGLLYIYNKGKAATQSHISPEALSESPPEYLYRILYRVNFVEDADSYLHSFQDHSSNRIERNKV